MLEGEAEATVGNEVAALAAGQLAVMPAGVPLAATLPAGRTLVT